MQCDYCPRQGWPTLDGMCERHYRDLVVFSLDHAVFRANQECMEAIEKVYKVEMALGLRPLMEDTPDSSNGKTAGFGLANRGSSPRSGAKSKQNDSEDVFI